MSDTTNKHVTAIKQAFVNARKAYGCIYVPLEDADEIEDHADALADALSEATARADAFRRFSVALGTEINKTFGFDALVKLQWDAMQSVGGDAATIMADAMKIRRDLDAAPDDT